MINSLEDNFFSLAEGKHTAETGEKKLAKNITPEQYQYFGKKKKSIRDTCFFCRKKKTVPTSELKGPYLWPAASGCSE